MTDAGFDDAVMEGHAFATNELTPEAYGGSVTVLIEAFVAALGAEEDARSWGEEMRALAARGEFFFACTQFCFSATRRA